MSNDKKDKTIRLRATQAFIDEVKSKMKKANIKTYSQFLRESVENTKIIQRMDEKQLNLLRLDISRATTNINQIAKHINSKKSVDNAVLNELRKTNQYLAALFESLL